MRDAGIGSVAHPSPMKQEQPLVEVAHASLCHS